MGRLTVARELELHVQDRPILVVRLCTGELGESIPETVKIGLRREALSPAAHLYAGADHDKLQVGSHYGSGLKTVIPEDCPPIVNALFYNMLTCGVFLELVSLPGVLSGIVGIRCAAYKMSARWP